MHKKNSMTKCHRVFSRRGRDSAARPCSPTVSKAHSTRLAPLRCKTVRRTILLNAPCPLGVRIPFDAQKNSMTKSHEVFLRRGRDSNPRNGLCRLQHFQCCAFNQLSHLSKRLNYYISKLPVCQVFFGKIVNFFSCAM